MERQLLGAKEWEGPMAGCRSRDRSKEHGGRHRGVDDAGISKGVRRAIDAAADESTMFSRPSSVGVLSYSDRSSWPIAI